MSGIPGGRLVDEKFHVLWQHSYVTGFAKTCIVHTSNFSTLNKESYNLLRMPDQPETFRICKVTIPLLILQIANLYAVPTRFYESLNEQNRICELCTFSQILSHIPTKLLEFKFFVCKLSCP